ncbi:MAG: BamA/TamA family outer membrane protein [Nitrosomonas sp.]|nr:BamA/TamA family outer membrane protein [Nitrosomonas sp.]
MPVIAAALATKPDKTTKIPDITIDAPNTIKKLVQQYIEFPEKPFASEARRASFRRRITREISELLHTEGYFTPEIHFEQAAADMPYRLNITPGPRTRVATFSLEFKGELADETQENKARRAQLRATWQLVPGKIFKNARWDDAKSALLADVMTQNYAVARIDFSEASINPRDAQANLKIVIDSGPAFRFGKLQVEGLERYPLALLQQRAGFQRGDPYNRDQLLAFQAVLQNSPWFSGADVNIDTDPALAKAAPVSVILTEAQSKHIGIGLGYSSNNGARSEINYRDFNFLQRAWQLTSLLRLEQKRQTFSTRVDTLPDTNHYRYTFGARITRSDIKNLKTLSQRADFSRIRTTDHSTLQYGINWQRESRQPAGAPNTIVKALTLDVWWRYLDIDNPVHVRNGHVSDIRIGGGSNYILSDRDFLRSYVRHMHWWPVGKRDVLHVRAEAGYTLAASRSGIPQEYLFRAGGIQSVRGHDFLSLGVREGDAIVGGRAMTTGTIEYVRWLTENWGTAVFADAGDAADSPRKLKLNLGYGAGVRWRSPAGPFALDLARRHDTGTLRVHFAIAVAF